MTQAVEAGGRGGRRKAFHWRVVLLLAALLASICATVILTDRASPRDRNAPNREEKRLHPDTAGRGRGADASISTDKGVTP